MEREVVVMGMIMVMEFGLLTIMIGWDCDGATKYLCQLFSLEFNCQHYGVITILFTLFSCSCNFMIFLGNKLLRL
jgi:hypothetical protein